MHLSSIRQTTSNVEIIRDNSFNTLGLTGNKYDNEQILVYLDDQKYLSEFYSNKSISCVICTEEIAEKLADFEDIGLCITEKPREAFYQYHNYLAMNTSFYGEEKDNIIDKSAKIHHTVSLGNHNIIIGERVIIEPHVTVFENVEIGNDCIIRAGAVIGSDPFQYVKTADKIIHVNHVGSVKIHDNVQIQSNVCIDRAVFKETTEIGEYSLINNLVHIAHDVKIGKRCLVGANATISGYTVIEDDAWIGPSSCIRNRATIGKGARVSMGAIVTKDVEDGRTVSGNFAFEHKKFLQFIKSISEASRDGS